MSGRYNKEVGDAWEELVAQDYQHRWYTILERKYKKSDGEIDIIAQNAQTLVFVEVKTVDHVDDLYEYVSKKKIALIQRTINYYLWGHTTKKEIVLDVVFVRNNAIIERYHNVTNN